VTQPQPHLDFQEIRTAAHQLGQKRREARRDYERYADHAAEGERKYRKTLAIAFVEARAKEGVTAVQAELEAASRAADARYERDIAQSMAKSALLRIEELEADRAMLRQLGDWSQRMEGVAA
jgi:hypothetical protein